MNWNENPNWPLLTGEILGALEAAGFTVEPVMDDDGYTNRMVVTRPSGQYLIVVVPGDDRSIAP